MPLRRLAAPLLALQQDMLAVMLPDLFIRFGEKAKAAEAKRSQP